MPALETFIGSNIITVDTALEPSGMIVINYESGFPLSFFIGGNQMNILNGIKERFFV